MTTKERVEYYVTAAMIVFLCVAVALAVSGRRKKRLLRGNETAPAHAARQPRPREQEKRKRILSQQPLFFRMDEAALAIAQHDDPFSLERLAHREDLLFSTLTLTGILCTKDDAFALINGVLVRRNDSIGKYTVTVIERKKVVLHHGSDTLVLELPAAKR